jgi:tRNA A37 threonylcarbamoyladenosine dehydratase
MSRSFVSTSRLFEEEAYKKLCNYRVGIIGLGGVGSWAAEALARSGIKRLVLIDYDHISESNINRQVQATTNTIGSVKINALANRLLQINPELEVSPYEVFFSEENSIEIFNQQYTDFWIDACDDIDAKLALINLFNNKERKKKILICGGAGGKTDPFKIIHSDLSKTVNDPLLSKLRYKLRRKYRFPRKGKMEVPVLSSNQTILRPKTNTSSKLSCSGYGSIVTVTASFGMMASFVAISQLLNK